MTADAPDTTALQTECPDSDPAPGSNCASPAGGPSAPSETPANTAAARRQALLLTASVVAATLLCLVLWNLNRSIAATLDTHLHRADTLAADVQAVALLKKRPQVATEATLQRSDLLERVSRAMEAARLDANSLISTLPQPPRRRPGSDHAEIAHRLVFENVELEPLVRFCHALTAGNPELCVSALHLRRTVQKPLWDADVSVSYRVLSLERSRS